MNKRHYEHTLPNIRGSLSNTYVATYARQMIIRESSVTERSLVTRCRLLNAVKSDNNPHGFIMESFEITENKDLNTIKR